jgi:hypothetical protein
MSKDQSDEELLAGLGVDITPVKKLERSPKEQRIIAGFEEILRFTKEQGREPQHGDGRDIFERVYATRLDAIRNSAECRKVLAGVEGEALLERKAVISSLCEEGDDERLLSSLGVDWDKQAEVSHLKYVRPRAEIRAAEEIAKRDVCKDFECSGRCLRWCKRKSNQALVAHCHFATMRRSQKASFSFWTAKKSMSQKRARFLSIHTIGQMLGCA